MSSSSHKTSVPSGADHRQWPLQVHQHNYGWTVTYYSEDGHIKHLLTVDSQMEAMRRARNLVRAYRLSPVVLVIGSRGGARVNVEKLLH